MSGEKSVFSVLFVDSSGYIRLDLMLSPHLNQGVLEGQSYGKRLPDIKFVVLVLGTGERWGVEVGAKRNHHPNTE